MFEVGSLYCLFGLCVCGVVLVVLFCVNVQDCYVFGEEIVLGLFLIELFLLQFVLIQLFLLVFVRCEGEQVQLQDLLFFDIEIIGLVGGIGICVFMIGVVDWYVYFDQGDGLCICQLVIIIFGVEMVMLCMFVGWLWLGLVFCSYNGCCYDVLLLKMCFWLVCYGDLISVYDYVDLLFFICCCYCGIWENCWLVIIECQLLQIVCEDDLFGLEVLVVWLNYLCGGSVLNLCWVVDYNYQDVVMLLMLMLWLVVEEQQECEMLVLQVVEFLQWLC